MRIQMQCAHKVIEIFTILKVLLHSSAKRNIFVDHLITIIMDINQV